MIISIFKDDQDRAKHQAARRWIMAVNHWGRLGRWISPYAGTRTVSRGPWPKWRMMFRNN